jgi:hypothetical protein
VTEGSFLATLDDEQRVRYYSWWRKYILLKRASRIAFAFFFVAGIFRIRYPDAHLARVFLAVTACAGFGLALGWSSLDCPRCGERFMARYTYKFFGDECQNCGLSGMQLSAIAKPSNHA